MALAIVVAGLGSLFAALPVAIDTTFVVERGSRLVIEHRSGDVEVRGVDGREARVLVDGRAGAVSVSRNGSTITIEPHRGWDDDANLEVRVPRDTDVEIYSFEGDVQVLDLTGDVSVETVEGEIEVRGAGAVAAQSVDGSVRLYDVRGGVALQTGDGSALLERVGGPLVVNGIDGDIVVLDGRSRSVVLSTVSGNVRYEGRVFEDGEYSLGSHDGDVTFALPEGVGARVSVSTFDGSLRASFPVQFRGGAARGAEFTVGGGGARITLESFDGDIFLVRPGERMPRGRSNEAAGDGELSHQSTTQERMRVR